MKTNHSLIVDRLYLVALLFAGLLSDPCLANTFHFQVSGTRLGSPESGSNPLHYSPFPFSTAEGNPEQRSGCVVSVARWLSSLVGIGPRHVQIGTSLVVATPEVMDALIELLNRQPLWDTVNQTVLHAPDIQLSGSFSPSNDKRPYELAVIRIAAAIVHSERYDLNRMRPLR